MVLVLLAEQLALVVSVDEVVKLVEQLLLLLPEIVVLPVILGVVVFDAEEEVDEVIVALEVMVPDFVTVLLKLLDPDILDENELLLVNVGVGV